MAGGSEHADAEFAAADWAAARAGAEAADTGAESAGAGTGAEAPPGVVFVLASASPGRAGTLRRAGVEPLILVSEIDEDPIADRYRPAGPGSDVPAAVAAELVVELARAKAHAVADQLTAEQVARHRDQWLSSPAVGTPQARTPRVGSPTNGDPSSPADASQPPHQRALEAIVVGCDSMLASQGRLVGKPHDPSSARQRIAEQSGQTVVLHTGHCVLHVRFEAGRRRVQERAQAVETQVHFGHLTAQEIAAYVATGEPLEVAGAFTIDGLGGPFIDGVTGDPHSVVGISLPLLRELAGQLGVAWPRLWTRIR